MASNPTVIVGHLDDQELKQSISNLVAHVKRGLHTMETDTTNTVQAMQKSLQSLGNLKLDSNSSGDGGSARRARRQQAETQAVKETEASYDQLLGALKAAQREVSIFQSQKVFTVRDIDNYKDAIARVVELNEKLARSQANVAMSRAMAAEKNSTFDAKAGLRDIFAVDARLKQLNQYYAQQEKLSQKEAQNNEKLEKQRLAAIEKEQQARQKLIDEQYKLHFSRAMKFPTDNLDIAQTKLEHLQILLREMRSRGILNPSQIASAEKEIQRLEQMLGQTNNVQQNLTQNTQQYTEEIRRQAQAIRESSEWQTKGRYTIDGVTLINLENSTKNRITLEEQLLQLQSQQAMQTRINAQEQEKVTQAAIGTAQILKSVHQMQLDSNKMRGGGDTSIYNFKIQLESVKALNEKLKELRDRYNNLNFGQRLGAEGKQLASNIQAITRQIQKLNLQLNRPIDFKSVMSLPTKTLDDIAYKMQRLAMYRSGLDINTRQKEINQINAAYDGLKKKMDEVMQKNQSLLASNNALGRSWNYMKNRLAFYFTVGASTAFIRNLIEVRSQYEMNERALGILVNSAEHGTKIFKELSDMSLISPYTLIELSSAARQLTAYGTAAKDVVDVTRRVADMAAAVGAPIERLTYALGHVQTYGYLTSLQARQFINAGIPIVKELSNLYTQMEGRMVSVADVYDRMKKKAVSYNDVMQVVTSMTDEGGRFFNFQAKMADTLKVSLANLTLAWNNMLNEIGQESQGVLSFGIKTLKQLFLHWRDLNGVINKGIAAFLLYKAYQALVLANMQALTRTMGWNVLIGKTLTRVFVQLGAALKAAFVNPATYVGIAILAFLDLLSTIKQNKKAAEELNDAIRKGAEESSSNIDKYLNNAANKDVRQQASTGGLDTQEANKAWESISEEIDTSTASAASLKRELLGIDDVNARVAKGFEYLEQIRSAQLALKDLKDDTIDISQDLWHGIFGEGLVSDLKDYANTIKDYGNVVSKSTVETWGDTQEFRKELDVTANSIKRYIDVLRIKDPFQIQEILEQVRAQIKMKNPEIKGELEKIFDIELDRRMATLTNGAVDQNASLWKMFMDELKRTSSSAFANLTDDIYNKSKNLNDVIGEDGRRAIDETLATFKSKMPFYYDAVKNMVADASQLRINIGVAFGVEQDLTSVFEKLTKADSSADEAYKKIQRLRTERKRLQSKGASEAGTTDIDMRYAKVLTELTEAEEDYNKAIAEGGTSKKENAASKKAQRAAETELQKALKDELQLIDKVRSQYKKLTDAGVDGTTALAMVTNQFDNSIQHINNVLGKNGMPLFDIKTFAGTNDPNMLLKMLDAQLKAAKNAKNVKPVEIKDLEVKYGEIVVDAKSYNYKKISDGLNNELGKLKDEYELAVELDADPELGAIFLDTLGISKEQLSELPKTAADVARLAQEAINREFSKNKDTENLSFNLVENLNKANLDSWFKDNNINIESDLGKQLKASVELVNKLRLDETKAQLQEWDKLLDKYAEYETKRKRIMEEAAKERETAMARNANKEIINAINRREKQELARVDFEEFQQTPTWITATGDLSNLTNKALGMLIERLEEYKKKATNLNPKQIKDINRALAQLYKEQKNGNPLASFYNAFSQAKERVNDYQIAIDDVQEKLDELINKEGLWTFEESQRYTDLTAKLKRLREEQKKVEKVSPLNIAEGFQAIAQAASNALSYIKDFADAFGNKDLSGELAAMTDVLNKTANMAVMGAKLGGAWGAVAGAAAGFLSGVVTQMADEWSGNAAITREIELSEHTVRRLGLAYKALEREVDKAYGTAEMGAQMLAAENKRLQLAELERQLELEKSRKQKNQDQDRILDLDEQIQDLRYEIEDSIDSITNTLLGISSVGDAAESMVGAVVDALRNGDDAIEAFNGNIDDMIANMVKKFISTKYFAPIIEKAFNEIDEITTDRTKGYVDQAVALGERNNKLRENIESVKDAAGLSKDKRNALTEKYQKEIDENQKRIDELNAQAQSMTELSNADVMAITQILENLKLRGGEMTTFAQQLLDSLGIDYSTTSDSNLSALQQGIQGITEDTASALEAYMNNVWQNVAVHTDLLTQIRDFMATYSFDVQLGISGQMLLQLQQSYQLQSTIATMLANWSSPNGMAVRVEMA